MIVTTSPPRRLPRRDGAARTGKPDKRRHPRISVDPTTRPIPPSFSAVVVSLGGGKRPWLVWPAAFAPVQLRPRVRAFGYRGARDRRAEAEWPGRPTASFAMFPMMVVGVGVVGIALTDATDGDASRSASCLRCRGCVGIWFSHEPTAGFRLLLRQLAGPEQE